MIIVHLDLRSSVPERVRDHVLADAAVEEKDQGGYAAVRSSSHWIASSMSRAERS